MGLLMLCVASGARAKQCSRLVTAEMRANALLNVRKYAWAAEEQRKAVEAAQRWMEMSDDELWALIPSQELPRAAIMASVMSSHKEIGCPQCGKGIEAYGSWKVDFWNNPWKVKCPSCGEVYPKNDFYAFYKTALDEHGMFRRELGDRSLLFNAEHPDPNDPLHNIYVDDGYGMVDEKANKYFPIAYYVQWGLLRGAVSWHAHKSTTAGIYGGLVALSRAYTLTGDKVYAHKAAVLLDRIADVYPEMDFMPLHKLGFAHSHGGSGRGRIEGCLCENDVVWCMSHAYDEIYDGIQGDGELVKFCAGRSARYRLADRGSIEAICRHVEENLLLEMLRSYKDGRIDGNKARIRNPAAAAIALDRGEITEEWLDYLFDPGFPHEKYQNPVPQLAVDGLDRDGMGAMCGGYGLMQKNSLIDLAEILAAYPDYTKHNLVAEYPKLRQCFLIEPRLNLLDAAMSRLGDQGGAVGGWGRAGNAETFVRGYRLYEDPRMAVLAWHFSGGNVERLRLPDDIFEENPEALIAKIANVANADEFKLECDHLGRYGQAVLQTESREDGRALWIHYGYGLGHSHADSLNIGLFAHNVDMLPEMGYPEYTGAWPKRIGWTSHTISHNTLMANDTMSGHSPGGKINLFAVQPPLRVMDVSSKTAYEGLETYRRSVAMVDISDSDSYVFDVFRARGGENHRLLYHSLAGAATVNGVELLKQAGGTFAGEDVAFGEFYDGPCNWDYQGSGFMYLYDVERSARVVDNHYTVDWKIEDRLKRVAEGHEPHLRLHALTECDEVALGSGKPPKPGKTYNPECLRCLIQSRLGENMESQFVTVLEPYDTTPFIRQVCKLQVEHEADPNSVAAVVVELADGTTDILINCEQRTQVQAEQGIEFDGQLGMIRLVNGTVKLMRMSNATLLKLGEVELKADVAAYEGTVTAIDAGDPINNTVSLDPPLPQDPELVGKVIHFHNDLPLDTSYDIKAVTAGGISTGDITIIRGFKNNNDFSAGYEYLVNPADSYSVPCHYSLER